LLTLEERQRTLSLFSSLGMTKLRFTGGEPTISKQLLPLIEYSKNISTIKSIGITTNGITLASNIDNYINAGLTNVNISLDTLDADKFAHSPRDPKQQVYLHHHHHQHRYRHHHHQHRHPIDSVYFSTLANLSPELLRRQQTKI
jgi:molybdenum cofactor biosynthesis enzyme MoaA